ncbi:hypothetical protein DRJ54_06060 [Candidatus Acetothermia bacterium]|nr:MAG: hypothetical protein DRJ54_06060 [Candidatus Acetothermia bacterium]
MRNRIEAVRDLLAADIRRGANNQLLITERGLDTLKALQELCETGHTLKEASNILRYEINRKDERLARPGSETGQKLDKQEETGWEALVEHLAAQVRALERRVAALEARRAGEGEPWWLRWTGAQ